MPGFDTDSATEQKKPVRYAAAANRVQVKATPANFRFRDVLAADSRSYGSQNILTARTDLAAIPSSSSMILSTTPRKGFRDDLRDDLAAFHIASTPNKVLATPIAAPAGAPFIERPTDALMLPSSPIMSRKPFAATLPQNYLTAPSAIDVGPSSPILPRLLETPIKQRPMANATTEEDITSTPPELMMNKTISKNNKQAVLFETPAKRAPATSAPAPPPPPTFSLTGQMSREIDDKNNEITTGIKSQLSLDQQLGWDDYDFDDL